MVTILTNCVFMTISHPPEWCEKVEWVYTHTHTPQDEEALIASQSIMLYLKEFKVQGSETESQPVLMSVTMTCHPRSKVTDVQPDWNLTLKFVQSLISDSILRPQKMKYSILSFIHSHRLRVGDSD